MLVRLGENHQPSDRSIEHVEDFTHGTGAICAWHQPIMPLPSNQNDEACPFCSTASLPDRGTIAESSRGLEGRENPRNTDAMAIAIRRDTRTVSGFRRVTIADFFVRQFIEFFSFEHLQRLSKSGNFRSPHKFRPGTARIIGKSEAIHGQDDVMPVDHDSLQRRKSEHRLTASRRRRRIIGAGIPY